MIKLTGKDRDNIKVENHTLTKIISKLASIKSGEDKCRTPKNHVKLRDQQTKTIMYIYRFLCQTLAGTINQQTKMDTYIKNKKLAKI